MSFLIKQIPKFSSVPLQLLSKHASIQTQKRFVYDASVFGIKEFQNLRQNTARKATPGFYDSIKNRLQASVDDKSIEIEAQDVNMFLLLSESDEDLDLLLKCFKKYKTLLLIDKDEQFGERFTKLCYMLEKTDKITDALKDEELQQSFVSQLTSFLIMNKLIIEKKYDLALDVFDKYLESISSQVKHNERPNAKTRLKKQNQMIPFGHLRLAVEALLYQNTKDSFLKMKEILKKSETFKSKLNNTALACCFLLALNQNENQFAYETTLMIEKFNATLQNNLKSIALCRLGKIDEAFYFIESIVDMKMFDKKNDFEGKFFPDTLKNFRESIDKMNDLAKKEKYELMAKEMEARLFRDDLFGYCTNINVKSNLKKFNKK